MISKHPKKSEKDPQKPIFWHQLDQRLLGEVWTRPKRHSWSMAMGATPLYRWMAKNHGKIVEKSQKWMMMTGGSPIFVGNHHMSQGWCAPELPVERLQGRTATLKARRCCPYENCPRLPVFPWYPHIRPPGAALFVKGGEEMAQRRPLHLPVAPNP